MKKNESEKSNTIGALEQDEKSTTENVSPHIRYYDGETEMEHIEIEYKSGEDSKHTAFGICKAAQINDEERTVIAVISTGVVDRDKEVLSPKGMNLDNFVKNPVVPWSHNTMEPPIGKALWIKKGTKKIMAKVKFAMTDRAEEVWQLFKGKFLNAFSVGFLPREGHRPTPDEIKANPELAEARFIYDKWELLEFSPVTVPANPQALSEAVKSKNIKLSDEMQLILEIEEISEHEEKTADMEIPIREISSKKYEYEKVLED